MQEERHNKLFSIIIPVYNVKMYIEECLNSLLNQTNSDYEIIIVNDGSTDGTEVICKLYSEKYSCIRVINQKNGGLSAARNAGIRSAVGKYIVFVDGDDYLENTALEKFALLIEKYEPEVVIADAWRINRDGKVRKIPRRNNLVGKIMSGSEFFEASIRSKAVSVCAPFNVYLRTLIVDNQLYFKEKILHEDLWWTPQVFERAKKVIYGDFLFYNHREREGAITSVYSLKNVTDILDTCYDLQNLIEDKHKKWLNDFLAQNYMSACYLGRKDIKKNNYSIDRKFPIKHAVIIKNRVKALIFAISPKLYFALDNIVKL